MAILHERLPCSPNFYKLKKQFRHQKEAEMGLDKSMSPVRTIASPKIMRGLSITKNQKKERNDDETSRVSSPDIRIRNHRLGSGSGFGRPSIQ